MPDRVSVDAGISVPLKVRTLTVSAAGVDSASPTVKVTDGSGSPSITLMSAIGVIVGGVLILAAAVTVNVRVMVWFADWPSFTVTVMVAVPAAAAVMVRLPALAGEA